MMKKKLFTAVLALLGFSFASPALADQRFAVADNGEVACQLSLRDITRISAVGDAFVTDIKRSASSSAQEYSVANEESRGDLYLSFPDGAKVGRVSFFGITRKNFVYKFDCTVVDLPAQQVFIENAAALDEAPKSSPESEWERLLAIGSAMAEGRPYPGFAVSATAMEPRFFGGLKVQVRTVYEGADLVGKIVDITNVGKSAIALREEELKPPGTVWFSVSDMRVEPGKSVVEYVLTRK
jgi:conjugal transfer pilus assembly protein TraK